MGTDAPFDYVDTSIHGNLWPLVKVGEFLPFGALLTATWLPAEQEGVDEDLGTLESGKLADMVFIKGNPLEGIEDPTQVKMTMKNGTSFTMDGLL